MKYKSRRESPESGWSPSARRVLVEMGQALCVAVECLASPSARRVLVEIRENRDRRANGSPVTLREEGVG